LVSKSVFKYTNNPNNIVFASRHLHEHFDGINKAEGVPSFALEYVSHSDAALVVIMNGSNINLYTTTVKITFLNDAYKNVLCKYFRDSSLQSPTEIQFELAFRNPSEFKSFSDVKAKQTYLKWKSAEGVSS
jgi:hypothetical protein